MAITTYSELKTAIENWYKSRSDVSSYVDDFIDMAEGRFNSGGEDGGGPIRHHEMLTTTDLTPTSNVCTLPSDYLHWFNATEKASIRRRLEHINQQGVDKLYANRVSGLSNHFTIVGTSLTAYPLSSNDIEFTYYAKIPALTDSNTSNWLLDLYPNMYLRTCLMYAADFFHDYQVHDRYLLMVNNMVDNLNGQNDLTEYGGSEKIAGGVNP